MAVANIKERFNPLPNRAGLVFASSTCMAPLFLRLRTQCGLETTLANRLNFYLTHQNNHRDVYNSALKTQSSVGEVLVDLNSVKTRGRSKSDVICRTAFNCARIGGDLVESIGMSLFELEIGSRQSLHTDIIQAILGMTWPYLIPSTCDLRIRVHRPITVPQDIVTPIKTGLQLRNSKLGSSSQESVSKLWQQCHGVVLADLKEESLTLSFGTCRVDSFKTHSRQSSTPIHSVNACRDWSMINVANRATQSPLPPSNWSTDDSKRDSQLEYSTDIYSQEVVAATVATCLANVKLQQPSSRTKSAAFGAQIASDQRPIKPDVLVWDPFCGDDFAVVKECIRQAFFLSPTFDNINACDLGLQFNSLLHSRHASLDAANIVPSAAAEEPHYPRRFRNLTIIASDPKTLAPAAIGKLKNFAKRLSSHFASDGHVGAVSCSMEFLGEQPRSDHSTGTVTEPRPNGNPIGGPPTPGWRTGRQLFNSVPRIIKSDPVIYQRHSAKDGANETVTTPSALSESSNDGDDCCQLKMYVIARADPEWVEPLVGCDPLVVTRIPTLQHTDVSGQMDRELWPLYGTLSSLVARRRNWNGITAAVPAFTRFPAKSGLTWETVANLPSARVLSWTGVSRSRRFSARFSHSFSDGCSYL